MPAPGDLPTGAPIWVDVTTDDLDATVAFYTSLLGWTHVDHGAEFAHYGTFFLDGQPVAGIGPRMVPSIPASWTVYLHTPDAAAAVETAQAAGGKVLFDADQVGELGTQAVLTDPSGAVVSLWQPGTHHGSAVVGEPGAPVWWELHTQDFDAVLPFYAALGWTPQTLADEPGFRYAVDAVDDAQYAGVMDDPRAGIPGTSRWVPYFGVASDEVPGRIAALGGTVLRGPEDTPYGRLTAALDPSGAAFSVMGPNTGETPAL